MRDSITQSQYAPACVKLLAQFKTILKLVAGDIAGSVDEFMAQYNVSVGCFLSFILNLTFQMDCPAAAHRLHVGVPATVEHSAEEGVETGKWVAETTQVILIFMLAIKPHLTPQSASLRLWMLSDSTCVLKTSSIPC